MKRITIRDVAREAKVSVTLVSFVMNAKRDKDGNLDCPVNADTAKRVLQVAQRLGYRRNFAAASLRSGRSYSIAVIPNDISNKFFAGISRCIEDKAKSYGYTVLFASSDESAERLESVMDAVLAHNIDGVIVAPCTGGEAAIRKATDAGVPVVLLDRDIEDMENVGKVLLDDQEAGKMATELFLKNGYKNAMAVHGLESNVHYTSYATANEEVPAIIKDAISRGVNALFLPTYSLSALVLMTMRDLGLKTPEDIAVIGFDVSDIYQLYSTTVTHIVQPLKELGEKSVDTLIGMIQGKPAAESVLKPEMIEGGSTEAKK